MRLIDNYIKLIFSYKNFKELLNSLAFAFIFAFIFQTFIYQPFKIPSGSMKPGLQIGDYLFVEKFAYGYNNSSLSFMLNRFDLFNESFFFDTPKRGDVIVFLLPKDSSIHYIKRLIGLPDDEIQIKDGLLYINNVAVKREPKGQKIDIEQNGIPYVKNIFEETLPNGVNYTIYTDNGRKSYQNNFDHNDTPVYKVPKGHYFFMGDNRDNSIDSRFLKKVGYVPKNKILGKAKILFWTSDFSVLDFITKFETNRAFKMIEWCFFVKLELDDYKFKDTNLLRIALTHPSAVKNKIEEVSYERMEFLGDSVLNVVIADVVYHRFNSYSEGELSIILANLVNSKTIVKVAKKLSMGEKIILDNGEEQCGGRENPNNLENVLEAVIAAIYLDSDFITIKDIVSNWWAEFFTDINKLFQKDYKSQLQELIQKRYKILPKYKTEDKDGEPHEPIFTISVSLKNKYKFKAQGKTKKEAEQKAAEEMLNFINSNNE